MREYWEIVYSGSLPVMKEKNKIRKQNKSIFWRALLSVRVRNARLFCCLKIRKYTDAQSAFRSNRNRTFQNSIRGPPCVLHFKKVEEMEDERMSKWIKIRIRDFYKDAIGETEYAYVSSEVYEMLTNTFRKEAHAEEMRDSRHCAVMGYQEGETEDLMIPDGRVTGGHDNQADGA